MFNKKNSVELTKVFNYGEVVGTPIRVQVINNEAWFVAKDICNILDIVNPRDSIKKILDDDEKGVANVYTPGGMQEMTTVNVSGFYHLVFVSRKPEAKMIRRWVTMEVLPSIMKTGKYEIKPRKRTLPRNTRPEMQQFFDELTQWVTLQDEKIVADLMNVTRKHVHEVLRGRIQSYGVMCMLVDCGKENRSKGLRRLVINQPRIKEMEQLRFEFMNNLTVEG